MRNRQLARILAKRKTTLQTAAKNASGTKQPSRRRVPGNLTLKYASQTPNGVFPAVWSTSPLEDYLQGKAGPALGARDVLLEQIRNPELPNTSSPFSYETDRWVASISLGQSGTAYTLAGLLVQMQTVDTRVRIIEHRSILSAGDVVGVAANESLSTVYNNVTHGSLGVLGGYHALMFGTQDLLNRDRSALEPPAIDFTSGHPNVDLGVRVEILDLPNNAAYSFKLWALIRSRPPTRELLNYVSC